MLKAMQESLEQSMKYALISARDIYTRQGKTNFDEADMVKWKAINQYTKNQTQIDLPRMLVGDQWLEKNNNINVTTPVVDEIMRLTGATATIFQRMNEAGDMLRVATNVEKLDGTRAIGTYIPRTNPDGTPNPVIDTIMRGETFYGRAFVVNAWYITAYEPIFNNDGEIAGVLYVGIKQENVTSLRTGIKGMSIGESEVSPFSERLDVTRVATYFHRMQLSKEPTSLTKKTPKGRTMAKRLLSLPWK